MIDIGVNLTNSRFDKDRRDVIARAVAAGVSRMVVTGTSVQGSIDAAELVATYQQEFPKRLYSTAGIHPHGASQCNDQAMEKLEAMIVAHPEAIVAVGETGLDFNRDFSPRDAQIKAFERQIELAIKYRLPLFLHERDAYPQQRGILESYGKDLPPAVIHCFTGNQRNLEGYLDMGLWIGVTGWVCDERRGTELQSIVSLIPHHRLMIETDAPYLTPRTLKPRPKGGRNEPAFLAAVAAQIATLSNRTIDEIITSTSRNAVQFFRLTG